MSTSLRRGFGDVVLVTLALAGGHLRLGPVVGTASRARYSVRLGAGKSSIIIMLFLLFLAGHAEGAPIPIISTSGVADGVLTALPGLLALLVDIGATRVAQRVPPRSVRQAGATTIAGARV